MASEQQKTTYTAAEVAVLEETILKQKAEIDELKRKLEHMNEVFANAQRARFGQSSEQKNYVLGKDQLSLFNEAESSQDHKAEEPKPETIFVEAHERKKKRSQAEMLNNLPEEEVLLEIPEEQRVCSKCSGKMKPIGKKFLRHEMQIIPKQIKLLAYYAVTYACEGYRVCAHRFRETVGTAHEALFGIPLYRGIHYDTEVCRRTATRKTGEDLCTGRCFFEPCYHGCTG